MNTRSSLSKMCRELAGRQSLSLSFISWAAHARKMGTPNDEVLHGHALYGLGLEFYKPMVVQNSTWITELKSINSVHRDYRPESWQNLRHYILPFQDCTFECVAEDFRVTIRHEGFPRLLWELSGGPRSDRPLEFRDNHRLLFPNLGSGRSSSGFSGLPRVDDCF